MILRNCQQYRPPSPRRAAVATKLYGLCPSRLTIFEIFVPCVADAYNTELRVVNETWPHRPQVLEVEVYHSRTLLHSAVHLYAESANGRHLVLHDWHHVISISQNLVFQGGHNFRTISLNPRRGERGMVIKTHEGDWALVTAEWAGLCNGVPAEALVYYCTTNSSSVSLHNYTTKSSSVSLHHSTTNSTTESLHHCTTNCSTNLSVSSSGSRSQLNLDSSRLNGGTSTRNMNGSQATLVTTDTSAGVVGVAGGGGAGGGGGGGGSLADKSSSAVESASRPEGRGRPGSPGHLLLHIHQLRQFQYRSVILPYERREYTFCLGGVTIDMERGVMEVGMGNPSLVENISLALSAAVLHVLCQPRPDRPVIGQTNRIPVEKLSLLHALGYYADSAPHNSFLRSCTGDGWFPKLSSTFYFSYLWYDV
ncbi:hypothetical protein Hamer_G003801 [Homarus americanus]|uniref:Uncharacterized protein n=1 Tax=Homarus americanus TaxID=6706 RepID=A0A8J5NG32_HOMAM|nr:hypothetical protein Hamer_G003801 [Homarus americanus]